MFNYSKQITNWLSGGNQALNGAEEVPPTVNAVSLVINNVRLAYAEEEMAKKLWKVECRGGKVINVAPADQQSISPRSNRHEIDAGGSIMLPSQVFPIASLKRFLI